MKRSLTRRMVLGAGAGILAMPFQALAAGRRIVTVAGSGVQGVAAQGESAIASKLDQPYGVLIGPDGALYWADFGSNRVLRLDRKSGKLSVMAGTGVKGHAGDGTKALAAQLSAPHEVRFDSKANMYVAERDAHVVRFVDRKLGLISTLVGTGEPGFGGDSGPSAQAQLKQPHSIVLDKNDNLFICDIQNNRVRRRDAATGLIATFAGNGEIADTPDEAPLMAPLHGPRSIDIGPDGTMYLILREGNKVFSIDPNRKILKRIAGTGAKGYGGDGGPARDCTWNGPKGIAYAPDGSLYVSDTENHVIRRVSLQDGTVSTVAGTGTRGDGPEGDPLKCALARPHGVCVHDGVLYIGDSENHRIRALTL
jgi:DNA-binding beta-propeller fold protein YncE